MSGLSHLTDVVCLMSGGLDSSMVAQLVLKETSCQLWPLYIQRGAAAEKFELQALDTILEFFEEKYPLRINPLKILPCTYPPIGLKAEYPVSIRDKYGYIGREVVMSHLAVFYALTLPQDTRNFAIATGSLHEDLFSHNSPEFWKQVNLLLKLELGSSAISIINPLQEGFSVGKANKAKVVKFAYQNNFPIEVSRSCVSDLEMPCGVCLECVQRQSAEKEVIQYV